MRHAIGGLHEDDAAGTQGSFHIIRYGDALFSEHLHQFLIVPLGGARIGTDEKARPVVGDPGSKLVQLAIHRIEQEYAADAIAKATHLQAPRRRNEAAAIAD